MKKFAESIGCCLAHQVSGHQYCVFLFASSPSPSDNQLHPYAYICATEPGFTEDIGAIKIWLIA